VRCGYVVGSSVSLAPALISIYDRASAVATIGGEAQSEHVVATSCAGWCDGVMPEAAAAAAEREAARRRVADIDRPASLSESSTVVKRATSSVAAMVLPGGVRPEVDMKKRPLSIRSTSSNTSTVSVTQRRRRKKQAVGDGVTAVADVDVDLPALTERLGQQAASFSDELNSLTSSLLERSESESSGVGDAGAVRLSSLLTDDELDVDVSPSSDCSDAGGQPGPHDTDSTSPSRSESYVDMVVAEILDTERSYVSDLRDVIQVTSTISATAVFSLCTVGACLHKT